MRRDLAERLLANIMHWSDGEKAAECAVLEAFAKYKYDEYQQYAPGLRFLESLALWLRQFKTQPKRQAAYDFVRKRLVFVSEAEMNHLVELTFPTVLRPQLVERTAIEIGIPAHRVHTITKSLPYEKHLRRTLVLGLSDGARTDRFRRANWREITNEQIWHAYDISSAKAQNLKEELEKDIAKLNAKGANDEPKAAPLFETVALLDDFTASGTSFLRKNGAGGWKGKIDKILNMLDDDENGLGALMCPTDVKVIVVLYIAAPQAITHLTPLLPKRGFPRGEIELHVVHRLGDDQKLTSPNDDRILELIGDDAYWDANADDEHAQVGGKSFRYGYADCALPVVLSHNAPNNSIFLLWAEESSDVHGLFPRVSRHRTFG